MRRGFAQPHFWQVQTLSSRTQRVHRSGAGFTLVELLISIAITGLLAAMMFSNFSNEKSRNALKVAVTQLQADIKAMQTNAQSGIVVGGGVPNGFGVHLVRGSSAYTLFADQNNDKLFAAANDATVASRNFGTTEVIVNRFENTTATNVDLDFTTPNGTASLNGASTSTPPTVVNSPSTLTIVLKHTKLGVCYAVTITKTVGTVSARQLATSTQCQ